METRDQMFALLAKKLEEINKEAESNVRLSPMVSKLFNVMSTEKAFVEFLSVSDLPPLQPFNARFTEAGQYLGYGAKISFLEFGLKTVREKKLVDDLIASNTTVGGSILASDASGFANSAAEAVEKSCADFWGNLTNANWDFMTSEEGLPVASNSHTTRVPGVSTSSGFDNLGTDAFDQVPLNAAWLAKRQYRASNGYRLGVRNTKLIILHPDNLTWKVEEVIKTSQGYEGPDQKYNPASGNRFESVPYSRLDDYDNDAWTLIDPEMLMMNFYFYNRINGEYGNHMDRDTKHFIQTYYKRYGLGYKPEGWRSIYHSKPA